MSTLNHHFATLMRHHREQAKLTAVDTAGKVGCSARTIANMEDGLSLPRLPVYVRLCRLYGLSLAQRAELDEVAAGMSAGGGE